MPSSPLISVGLPVYNGENYLQVAIDGLLAQTLGDLELIIVDNASTDATEEICLKAAAADPRVLYHRNDTNIGASANYNKAFELSRGRYFKWAAHDDECRPRMLEACVEVLEEAPDDVVLAYPLGSLIDEDGVEIRSPLDRVESLDERPEVRVTHLLRSLSLCDPVFGVYRSDALRRTGLIGGFCGADYVLLSELALTGKIREVDEVLFGLRRHGYRSNTVNRSIRARTAWYSPSSAGGRVVLPIWEQMMVGLLKVIVRADLTPRRKVTVAAAALRAHYGRRLRVFGGRHKARLRSLVRR